ncbi:PTS alpha-glucoside transporter subunit IIA [Streptomyces griseocarneus]|nr:PTS alpha-glucoside transporter subunit IIA [Streptomyces griseocarneus]
MAPPGTPPPEASPATPHDHGPDRHTGTAAALLPLLGGAANLVSVAHCMTRLRLELHDRAPVRDAELRALPGVLGVVDGGTSYQVVLGPGTVARVAPELDRLRAAAVPLTAEALAARGAVLRAERAARNSTPGRLLLRRIAAVFVPLIPALIGCGIVAALAGLLANTRLLPGLVPALVAVASGFMALIAVFVGVNTAKEFGGTPVLGGAVAAVTVFGGVMRVDVFGERLVPGEGGVLGALAAALLAVRVEKWCRHRVPEALDVLLTPTLTVLVAGLVTLYGLMSVAGRAATAIGYGADWLLSNGGAAAGFLLGGLFLPLVLLGLHQALIPIHATLIQQQGYTVLLPLLSMAGAGQVGAALAVHVRLRDAESVRRTVRSALPAGLLGIGEPLIYGVSLPLGRPFFTACVGGAFGGGFVGLLAQSGHTVGATAIGPSGWALFPLLNGSDGPGRAAALYGAGLLIGYLTGFLATYFFGFTERTANRKGGTPVQGVPPSACVQDK